MAEKITYKVVFNRLNRLNKDGEALIHILVYHNSKKYYFSTGLRIQPEHWDAKNKKVKNTHPQADEYNWIISNKVLEMQRFEMQKRVETGGNFSIKMFKEMKNTIKKNYRNFWTAFDNYLLNHPGSKSRKDYIKRTIKKLKEFKQNLTFKNFKLETIQEFDIWLRNQNYHINTIAHFHKVVKAFFNQMRKQEVIDKNPYDKFKIKKEKTIRPFLTADEVEIIENLQLKYEELTIVKDIFLFACYTGLRFSDVQSLKPTDFNLTKTGVYLFIKQKKTKEILQMPLHMLFNAKPVNILKKYYSLDKKFIFPRYTNQAINRQLKVIGQIADIKKRITFHMARHTFGTLLAYHTKDPYLIKQLMGHADIQTSMTYIHLSNRLLEERLKNIDW